MSREQKSAQQRAKRAAAALAAGRLPGRTGRPPTGRKAAKQHGNRAAQYRRRRARLAVANGDNGTTTSSHPLMDAAIAMADRHVSRGRSWYLRTDRASGVLYQPLWEETVCVAALAAIEGQDVEATVRAFVIKERAWRWRTLPLAPWLKEGDVHDDDAADIPRGGLRHTTRA